MKIANAQLWVHDQEVALDYYVNKVGMRVRADITVPELGGFRWLTVSPEGQDDVTIVLMAIPPAPIMDDATNAQVHELMAKGFAGTIFLTTDDVQRDYDAMVARGVEFTSAPEQQPYGVDCGFRDPSGNNLRLAQLADGWKA